MMCEANKATDVLAKSFDPQDSLRRDSVDEASAAGRLPKLNEVPDAENKRYSYTERVDDVLGFQVTSSAA